jgi:hypothetical protein
MLISPDGETTTADRSDERLLVKIIDFGLASALETQVYQAILERRPEQVIPRLKEILIKFDPALGYINGELRFWLGWAQKSLAKMRPRKLGDRRAAN